MKTHPLEQPPEGVLRITVSGLGSRGDVQPVLALARQLKRSGHEITLLVPPDFAEDARALGFDPHLYEMDIRHLSKKMKNGLSGILQVMRWFLESVRWNTDFMIEHTRGADLMVTSSAEMHAPTVAEYLGIPHYRIVYAPVLPGDHTPPIVPMRQMPRFVNKAVWFALNEGMFLGFGRNLNQVRRRLGLPRVKGMLEYLNRDCRTLLAYSPDLAPPVDCWDWDFRYSGYCFGDTGEDLPEEVLAFLSQGPPPIYIGFGSMNLRKPDKFLRVLEAALEGTELRVVLSRGWQDLELRDHGRILTVGDLPHDLLFPKVAGVCHHGGSGTTHTAARAGVPQFIMPYALDQFYWSRRIHALGLGPKPIPPHKLTPSLLRGALLRLAGRERYARNARELGKKLAAEKGTETAARIISHHFQEIGEVKYEYGSFATG
jgi:vancomycin aglycone glucosyltransferase